MAKIDRLTALAVLKDISKHMYPRNDLFGNKILVINRSEFEKVRHKYLDRNALDEELEYIRGLISGLYTIEGCAAGGLLHIVTDDGNLRDSDIKFCLKQCEEHPEEPEAKLGKLICTELLKLTEEERELI